MINWIKNLFKKPEVVKVEPLVLENPKKPRGRPKKINKIDKKDK